MQTSPAGHRGASADAGSQALPRFEPVPQTRNELPEGVCTAVQTWLGRHPSAPSPVPQAA